MVLPSAGPRRFIAGYTARRPPRPGGTLELFLFASRSQVLLGNALVGSNSVAVPSLLPLPLNHFNPIKNSVIPCLPLKNSVNSVNLVIPLKSEAPHSPSRISFRVTRANFSDSLRFFFMKITSFDRAILLALLMALAATVSAQAQAAATTNASGSAQMPPPMLDNDELTHLQTVRAQVLSANPDLKTEEEKLTALHAAAQSQNPPPTAEQRNAAFAEWKAYQKKMRGLMLQIDPTLVPIFAKMDEARKHGAPTPFQPATTK
jgi:hypothetical protein